MTGAGRLGRHHRQEVEHRQMPSGARVSSLPASEKILPWAYRSLLFLAIAIPLIFGLIQAAGEAPAARWTAPVKVAPGELNEYPDVAVDANGTAWVVWVGAQTGQEHILLRGFKGVEGLPTADVGLENGLQAWPRVLTFKEQLWVIWCAKVRSIHQPDAHWRLLAREIKKGVPGTVIELSSPAEDALRPVPGLDARGRPFVAWESRLGKRFRIMLRALEPLSAEGEAELPPAQELSDGGELNLRPTLTRAPGEGLYVFWDRYDGNHSQIVGRKVSIEFPSDTSTGTDKAGTDKAGTENVQVRKMPALGTMIRISPESASNLSPSAVTDKQGRVFIAYSTNSDGKGGIVPAGRKLRLRVLEQGALTEPVGGQVPRILTHPKRLDAVEFPTLQLDPEGRPWLFARRGQGWIAFCYDGDRWKLPVDMSEGGWGGRGRELRAAWSPDGFHLVARRLHMSAHQLFIPYMKNARAPMLRPASSEGLQALPPLPRAEGLPGVPDVLGATILPPSTPLPPVELKPELVKEEQYVLDDGVGPPRKVLTTAVWAGQGEGLGAPLPREMPVGVYYGDLHTHSWLSDGAGDPDEIYTRSRDRYRYHFVALTDHDLENGNRILPSEWDLLKLWAEFFNDPGRFVTFQAYEWTDATYPRGGGHKNVYYPGAEAPIYNVAAEAPDSKTLFELLQAEGAFAAPHHVGWTGTDWENHNPQVQRAVELVSVHGAFEKPGNLPILPRAEQVGMFVRDGLLRGLRFGFLGGSDGHGFPYHYGVSRREDPWRTGITGILAMALERSRLHAAMMNRHTIASSGPPIGVWLHVNGSPMGTELVADREPRVDVRVEGLVPLSEVVVVRDGEDKHRLTPDGLRLETSFTDALQPGTHFYYVRATQKDGEVAWSSPVWVDVQGGLPHGPPDP